MIQYQLPITSKTTGNQTGIEPLKSALKYRRAMLKIICCAANGVINAIHANHESDVEHLTGEINAIYLYSRIQRIL